MKTPPPKGDAPPPPVKVGKPLVPYERMKAGELRANGMGVRGQVGFVMQFVNAETKAIECQVPFHPDRVEFFEVLRLFCRWFYYGKEPPASEPSRPVSDILGPDGQRFGA